MKRNAPGRADNKRDIWVVRDDAGMLHRAAVHRYFWEDRAVRAINVATACRPSVTRVSNTHRADWSGVNLPKLAHDSLVLVEWRVREEPTCLACLVAEGADLLGGST